MTHPGVGFLTGLAYVLIIGTPERFHRGKQIGTYVGIIPPSRIFVSSSQIFMLQTMTKSSSR